MQSRNVLSGKNVEVLARGLARGRQRMPESKFRIQCRVGSMGSLHRSLLPTRIIMKRSLTCFFLFLVVAPVVVTSPLLAQDPAFTYQGRLLNNGQASSGNYDFQFVLRDAPVNGTQIGGPLTNAPVQVTDGLFTVLLDFGSGVFDGSSRWLEIGVRTNGSSGPYVDI